MNRPISFTSILATLSIILLIYIAATSSLTITYHGSYKNYIDNRSEHGSERISKEC